MLPIMLDLSNKSCVIVGGGKIALRKLKTLINTGASIKVVSPTVLEEIKKLAEVHDQIELLTKEVEIRDYCEAFLIIAATDSETVNEQIAKNTSGEQLVNVAHNHELGNFLFPASFARGKLTISVSTGGASPHLAKQIREELKEIYDENYEGYLEFLFECRQLIKEYVVEQALKNTLLEQLLDDRYRNSENERHDFLDKLKNHTGSF